MFQVRFNASGSGEGIIWQWLRSAAHLSEPHMGQMLEPDAGSVCGSVWWHIILLSGESKDMYNLNVHVIC